MRYLVTVADYEKCVAAHACDKLAANVSRGSDLPAVWAARLRQRGVGRSRADEGDLVE